MCVEMDRWECHLGGHAKDSHFVVVQPKAAAQESQCMVNQERQAAHMLVEH